MHLNKTERRLLTAGAIATAAAAAYFIWFKRDVPKGATVVQPFDIDRYLGTWYELARLPTKIETDMQGLTEKYTRRQDGYIGELTRAFDTQKNRCVKSVVKSKPAARQNVGRLKVSYLEPFYFAYNVLDIDENYQYALVSGS